MELKSLRMTFLILSLAIVTTDAMAEWVPVSGVEVFVKKNGMVMETTRTDERGKFRMLVRFPGKYVFRASCRAANCRAHATTVVVRARGFRDHVMNPDASYPFVVSKVPLEISGRVGVNAPEE